MRCRGDLKADNSLHLAQERGLPAIDFELLRVELYRGQRRIGAFRLIRGDVLGPQFQAGFTASDAVGKTIDCEAQVGQHVVIDDIVEKDGIRVEGVLRQDDAILECAVLADGVVPGIAE
jgi:hypothetical protein